MKSPDTDARKPTILAVDDDWGAAELTQMMLQRCGYDVQLLHSGQRAIDALTEMAKGVSRWNPFPVDLILLDVMMPGMDGFSVCQIVKADPLLQYIPVIMVTALDGLSDVVAAVQFGADGYITKPFLPEELDAAIKAKLQIKEREQALLHRNAELMAINAVAAAASSSLDPRRAVEAGFAALLASAELPAAAVYVLDDAQACLRLVVQEGVTRPETLPIDRGLSGEILKSDRTVLKADLENDPDLPSDAIGAGDVRAFVGVPLRAGGRSLGILEVYHREPHSFAQDALEFFAEIGDRMGMALQNAVAFTSLLHKSAPLDTNSP